MIIMIFVVGIYVIILIGKYLFFFNREAIEKKICLLVDGEKGKEKGKRRSWKESFFLILVFWCVFFAFVYGCEKTNYSCFIWGFVLKMRVKILRDRQKMTLL